MDNIKRNNVPFFPHNESCVKRIEEGAVNLYHVRIEADGTTKGARTYLFSLKEGGLIFPLQPSENDKGSITAILAVPTRDSRLEDVESGGELSQLLQSSTALWVSQCCERLAIKRDECFAICASLNAESLADFNKTLMKRFEDKISHEEDCVRSVNRRRLINDDGCLQNALGTLEGVISQDNAKKQIHASLSENPLIMACEAVAESQGMSITISEAIREGRHSGNLVEDIASVSHFRIREVILSGKWYKQNGGSFLAKTEEGAPLALIQDSPRSYIMYNPSTDERIKVTKKLAATLNPKAVMFYRNLPAEPLGAKDVLKFVMRGIRKSDWLCVAVMGIGGGLLGMLSPEITGRIFDTVIPDGNRGLLIQIGFLMAAMALTTFVFELTRAFAMQRVSGDAEKDLQSAVLDRLLTLPVKFFKQFSAGELAQRAMGISQIREILSSSIVNTILAGTFSVFYIIVMFSKSIQLAWIGIAIIVVTLLISLLFGYLQMKYEGTLLDIDNKLSGRMFGWISGLSKIKMSGAEKRIFYHWSGQFRDSRAITLRKESIGNISYVFNSSVIVIASMLLYVAIFNLPGAKISTGAFIAFNAALQKLISASIQTANAVMSVNVIIPLYKKVKPIFETTPEYDEHKEQAGELSGNIELSHINFSYDPNGPQIIKDVSMQIRSGEHVALVGPSGSGKSTLFRILLAFEKPDSGEIYFDGVNLDQFDIRSIRRQLGVVMQSGQLLAGSVFENIVGSNPSITMNDALRAIQQAGMEDDLKQMPMGLHTMISEGLGTLSGGQRQRLLIARALAGNPKILFFDEATSALDNKTQKIVSDSVNQLKATRITIAHRLSTIQDCDRIIVLEKGRITEEGTYQELMDLNGTFAMMARRQTI